MAFDVAIFKKHDSNAWRITARWVGMNYIAIAKFQGVGYLSQISHGNSLPIVGQVICPTLALVNQLLWANKIFVWGKYIGIF